MLQLKLPKVSSRPREVPLVENYCCFSLYVHSHIEIALFFSAAMEIIIELWGRDSEQFLDTAFEAFEVRVVLHLAAVLGDLLLELFDVL